MDYSETRAAHMIAGHLSGHPHIAIDKPAFFPKILYTARVRIELASSSASNASHHDARKPRRLLRGSRIRLILVKSVHTAELTTNTAQGTVKNGSFTLAGIAIVKSIDLIRKTTAPGGPAFGRPSLTFNRRLQRLKDEGDGRH
jgi:hypothetical protein